MTTTTTSDALVDVADYILAKVAGLSTTEISKRGRKYRFVNNNFQRVREEDKHLVIHPEHLEDQVAVVSAYGILAAISPDIFVKHKNLCLIILGVARALEEHHWYEQENSSVVHFASSKGSFDPALKDAALALSKDVTPDHLAQGYNLLYCSKLNFLHTDHHIGSKLEGHYMRLYVERYFGEEALESPEMLSALKSFSHWANIKGLLYKLGLPHMDVDDDLQKRFSKFPDPPAELSEHVHSRFPSGTSKYSMTFKAIDNLAHYKYSRLIPYPQGPLFDSRWLFELCADIARDPARYHLRSKAKKLSPNPANLQELSQHWKQNLESLLSLVSMVTNTFPTASGDFLQQNTRIPPLTEDLKKKHHDYYQQLLDVAAEIEDYESKDWAPEDIILRMHKGHVVSLYDEIERVKNRD
ncbi:hypothetical protein JCM33374_g2515 [Metschnikowia sp. JCM 33374]|nr:hypothetical protein JCM33374_g2515 [Metschnikowia sp. JCM 33374]